MTNTLTDGAALVVVDGSNIATEGRSVPSLAQLNDAVLSLTSEFPDITVTVVVDATFGHRIDRSEVAEFDEAVAHNELVTPPAGAIGRGDAFVLSIANKVGARIFSNDSFQEFHGVYPWLFDEGRLIGGKPVPHVGWVFVNRVPVKGPLSRKARGAAREGADSRRPVSKLASLPMPVPTSPPPGRAVTQLPPPEPSAPSRGRRRRPDDAVVAEPVPATGRDAAPATVASGPVGGGPVNDLLPFLDFVQHHPVGTSVTGTVESYSSHGAYITIGEVRGYVPLRLMGAPPPRSARSVMRMGEFVTLVVASFAPGRRSVDLAVPGVAPAAVTDDATEPTPARRSRKAAPASLPAIEEQASAPRRGRKKAAASGEGSAPAAPEITPVPADKVEEKAETRPTATRPRAAKAAAAGAAESKRPSRTRAAETTPAGTPATETSSPRKRTSSATRSAEKRPARKSAPPPNDDEAAEPTMAEPARTTRSRAKKSTSAGRDAELPPPQPDAVAATPPTKRATEKAAKPAATRTATKAATKRGTTKKTAAAGPDATVPTGAEPAVSAAARRRRTARTTPAN